jgi:hypothetical protein
MQRCNAFAAELFAPLLERGGASRFVEDTPGNIMAAPRLLEMFPDMRLIRIYRDPRDNIASAMTKNWAPSEVEAGIDRIRLGLEAWDQHRTRLPAASLLEVKFEDWVADPRAMVEQICHFTDLEVDPPMLEMDRSRHNIGRYKRDLTPRQIKVIEDALGPWMAQNGYER